MVGRRLFDARVGLLAAAFADLTVIQIQNAHFYVAEPFMVMFLTFALYALIRTLQERRLRWAGATGLLLGLAVATA
ncbi:MAG: glycosyltransferase family 39 protein [Chloroflexia bacterium]